MYTFLRRVLSRLLCWMAILFAIVPIIALAHEMPRSSVMLKFEQEQLLLDLRLPLDRLEVATGMELTSVSPQALTELHGKLKTYILERIRVQSEQGQDWTVRVQSLNAIQGTNDELEARLILLPPPEGSLTRFRLNYEVILREIATHTALVSVQSDWDRGVFASKPELLGALRFDVRAVDVNRLQPQPFAGFFGMFRSGIEHIATGTDHMLFLMTLLLTAPVLVIGRRWKTQEDFRKILRQVIISVSAFTIGHSVSLAVAALGIVSLPISAVEVFIATSVLISAAHAVRPIYPGREYGIVFFFGLVHGLAFAASLTEFDLKSTHMAAAILGFNLGIETIQILLVLVAMPFLILLSKTPWYGYFRITFAAATGMIALGWMAERAMGWHSPLSPFIELLPAHILLVGASMLVLSLLLYVVAAQPKYKIRASQK